MATHVSEVASDQFLSSTTFPLRLHLTLFMNAFENVFGQTFHFIEGLPELLIFFNMDIGITGKNFNQLGKEKRSRNTHLSHDLITKKSTMSNTISETWDELNLTKCTSGGMIL